MLYRLIFSSLTILLISVLFTANAKTWKTLGLAVKTKHCKQSYGFTEQYQT